METKTMLTVGDKGLTVYEAAHKAPRSKGFRKTVEALRRRSRMRMAAFHAKALCRSGQGTTEYAILVGVLVVIAILAITMFRPKVEELWNAIANGINGL